MPHPVSLFACCQCRWWWWWWWWHCVELLTIKHRIRTGSMCLQERYFCNAGNASPPTRWRYIWTCLLFG